MTFLTDFFFFHFSMLILKLPLVFILDAILGEPKFIVHPVVLIGKLISKLEKKLRKIFKCQTQNKIRERIAGTLLSLIICFIAFSIPFFIELVLFQTNLLILLFILDVFWGYQALAARCLCDEALNVHKQLSISLEEGQNAVARIVGRETKTLDEKGVIKACVETVAENTTDGIFSPMIFYFFGGASFSMLFKAINTLDSMIAYKNERYIFFGTFSARLDDIANFIPARICAFFMIFSSIFFPSLKTKNAIKIFFRDRKNHSSPNSAQTESVMAGLLNTQLLGDAIYEGKLEKKQTVGDLNKEIEIDDIKKSVFVMYFSTFLFLLFQILICFLFLI